jgi:hypothetical protein
MQKILQIHVSLLESDPPIWRRVLLSSSTRLPRLHTILQVVMGWENYHLHEFRAATERYGPLGSEDPYDDRLQDEATVTVGRLLREPGDTLEYEYDFGDSWLHTLVLEKVQAPAPGLSYPVCIEGAQACPPEDAGGMHGYYHYLRVIVDPTHEEHQDLVNWRGPGFDPSAFSLPRINASLKSRARAPLRSPA